MTTPGNPAVYEFGSFRLDAADGTLARNGVPVPMAPKVGETLLVLVEHAGSVVTKERLMARVWPDTFVEESNLAQNITTEGRAWDPAISPDGRFVAYAVLDGEAKSVWLKNIATGNATQIMPPTSQDYRGLHFSPDGNELFYKTFRPGYPWGIIMRV